MAPLRAGPIALLLACFGCSAAESPAGSASGSTSLSTSGGSGATSGGNGGGGAGDPGGAGGFSPTTGAGGAAPTCTPGVGGAPAVDCASVGITLVPPYDADYSCLDLGTDADIPPKWGGLTTRLGDPSTLLIGGAANVAEGKLYSIGIVRDAGCHVIGFSGAPAAVFSEAAYNDGGVRYGPSDVLFLARWPVNEIGFMKPGSVVTDKIIPTEALGVAYSLAALDFVPTGFGGEGQLKLVGWPGGEVYTAAYAPDGAGTFDLTGVTYETTIVGGPEGIVYIEAGNPQFAVHGMLVSEWTDNQIAAYDVDGSGNPIPATRRDFLVGLTGAEGAFLDPLSGDFLFSTFADYNRVIAVRGFKPPPPIPDPE